MIPSTVSRVARHTATRFNTRIHEQTERNISQTVAGGRRAVERRLAALDHEWDIERTLEANAATVSLIGYALGAFVHRRFFALPALVAAFLLQHAVQGWCPPLRLFRQLGVRTQSEIERERRRLEGYLRDMR
jgi:hypothetical protein